MQEGGLAAFYKGNGTNVLKIIPETAVKFWAYETLKHLIAKNPENITIPERFSAGALAGLCSQTLVYPLEITKTRLSISTHYKGIFDCITSIVRTEGTKNFSLEFFLQHGLT